MEIRPITAEELRVAISGSQTIPLEQMGVWEEVSGSLGMPVWGRLGWFADGKPVAATVLFEHRAKGLRYLWARNGPVWMKPPTPSREQEALELLARHLRKAERDVIFVRVHSWYQHPELREPFRVITYDRTVRIDTARGNAEAAFEALPTAGKRLIRRARKQFEKVEAVIAEETGLSEAEFNEFYSVLEETATRDDFTAHPRDYYWTMLEGLGADHARLFSVRVDGELAAWDLVGVHGKMATAYFGASTEFARRNQLVPLLDFEVARMLGEEGITGLDLMGIHSPRVPELYGVGRYKQQFSKEFVDVAGLWDLPIRPAIYSGAIAAYTGRNWARESVGELRSRFTKPRG